MSADFWAGYVSGAVGIVIGNPLDLVKTRLQAGPAQHVSTSPETATTARVAGRGFKGQFENAGTLVRGKPTCSLDIHTVLKGNGS
jgi:solute carrier family 25 carnitine/acylcarnitine transporter 20/29